MLMFKNSRRNQSKILFLKKLHKAQGSRKNLSIVDQVQVLQLRN